MALSDVLNNLTGARDALVSAINGKGGTVAASATLRQCAAAVTALPEGGVSSGNDPVFDGLIFYLSFDRWMIDSVNCTQATWSGISPVDGKNGICGQFDGISAKAAIPRDVVSIKGKSAWSVAGWLKPEALTQTKINPIYAEWNASDYGSARFSVQISSDLKIFSQVNFTDYQEDVNLFRVSTEDPVAAGEWLHFAVVVNLVTKTMRLYINGSEVANATNISAPESAPDLAPYNDPRLMHWGADNDYCVPGCLDEFAIWHRALSSDEVAALYNSGAGLFYENMNGIAGGGGVEIPGQIFHASFAEDSEYAESGQPLVKIGTLVFSTVDGIPCVRLGEGGFQVDYPLFTGNKPFTISYWGKCVTENDPGPLTVYQGQAGAYRVVFLTHNGGNFCASNGNVIFATEVEEKLIFHHFLFIYDTKKYYFYVDGNQIGESSSEFSLNIYRENFYIGYDAKSINTNQFYLANMRIFTRVLSAGEISTLYEEFRRATGSGGDVSVDPVGELFFTTTEADGKVEGGYMFAGTGTLKLQLATGEITELSLTDTMQRAFSAYELSSVRVVSGAERVTLLSINRIGIDYIDLSNFWSLEHLNMPISSSPEIKNLSSCHRLNYVDVGNSALSSAQVDQLLADILASNSHLNYESFSGSIDVSQNAVPTAAGLETIAQLESVGWSVNYDRE